MDFAECGQVNRFGSVTLGPLFHRNDAHPVSRQEEPLNSWGGWKACPEPGEGSGRLTAGVDMRTAPPTPPRSPGSSQDHCEKRLFQRSVISACHQPYGLYLLFNLTFPQKFAVRKGHQMHTLSSNSLSCHSKPGVTGITGFILSAGNWDSGPQLPAQGNTSLWKTWSASAKDSYALYHGCPWGLSAHWGPPINLCTQSTGSQCLALNNKAA